MGLELGLVHEVRTDPDLGIRETETNKVNKRVNKDEYIFLFGKSI